MIKAYTIDATVTAVWAIDPAFDIDHKVDPNALKDEWRLAIEGIRKNSPGALPAAGPVLAWLVYQLVGSSDPGAWKQLLKVRDAQQPTEFILGPIPAPVLNRIEHELEGEPMFYACFKESLRDIKNGPHDTVGGKAVVPHDSRDGYEIVSGAWIDNVFLHDARKIANAIGRIAWAWNQLGGADAKN